MDFCVNADGLKQAKALYGEIFGDIYADMFFDTTASVENTYAIEENGQVVSIAFAVDKTFVSDETELKAVYVCGVATKEEARGRGLSGRLLEFIEQKYTSLGYDFAYLVPASKSLFDMYAKYGFKTCFYLNKKEYETNSRPLTPDKERWCSVRERYDEYAKQFDLYQKRTDKDWEFIETEFGGNILNYSSDGYVFYYTEGDRIFVRESTLATKTLLLGAIAYIAKKTGAVGATVYAPTGGDGTDVDYAMAKCFTKRAQDVFLKSRTRYTNANFE